MEPVSGQAIVLAQAEEATEPHGAPLEPEPLADEAPVPYDGLADTVAEGEVEPHGEVHEESLPWAEIWLVLALAILVALAYRPAKRAILGALDARAVKIKTDLDEAQRLREEAQATLANYQRRQRDALAEAEQIVAHARQDAERMREQARLDLEQTLQRRERLALDRVAQAEANAVAEVRTIAVDVAVEAARRMIRQQVKGQKATALIDDSIESLPGKLH